MPWCCRRDWCETMCETVCETVSETVCRGVAGETGGGAGGTGTVEGNPRLEETTHDRTGEEETGRHGRSHDLCSRSHDLCSQSRDVCGL